MKITVGEKWCKGCIWLNKENLCPFTRCVRESGFITDKKVTR